MKFRRDNAGYSSGQRGETVNLLRKLQRFESSTSNMNSKQQGDIGVAMAIAYYTAKGYAVSVPLTDNTLYDLIVDNGELQRVQVKTTTYKRTSYEVKVGTSGGNQSWTGKTKTLDSTNCDLVFVYAFDGSLWEFPAKFVHGKDKLTLSTDKDSYRVKI